MVWTKMRWEGATFRADSTPRRRRPFCLGARARLARAVELFCTCRWRGCKPRTHAHTTHSMRGLDWRDRGRDGPANYDGTSPDASFFSHFFFSFC